MALALGICGLARSHSLPAADDLTRPIQVSADGRFFIQPDGKPFFMLGDWAWELFKNPNRAEVEHYLQDRSRKGFNVIFAPIPGYFGDLTRPNVNGDLPFIANDPLRPNPRYFEDVDWIVKRAAHYGLRMGLLPSWGKLVTGGFAGQSPIVIDAGNARQYGNWLAARYRHQGVLWVLGGDTNPLWPKKITRDQLGNDNGNTKADSTIVDYRPVYDALAAGLEEGSDEPAFIAYHPTGGSWPGTPHPRTSLYFADRPWLDMNAIQSGHHLIPEPVAQKIKMDFIWKAPLSYQPITDEYNSTPARPIVDLEPRIEDLAINLDIENGYWKPFDMRTAAYQALFAGAAGHAYANESLGLFYDPARGRLEGLEMRPWQEAISSPGSSQMQHAKALLLSRPYFTRIPDQSVIVGNAGEGEPHIAATRDKNGSFAMIYLPHGQKVTADLSKLSGTHAVAWWYNTTTGAATRIPGEFPTSSTQRFSPPTSGADVDWVLVLDDKSRGFKAPGKPL
jgi:hypothetical protein